jgi:hypothetical protein
MKKFLIAVVMAAPVLALGAAPHAQADNDPGGACRAWEKAVAGMRSSTVTYDYDQIIAPLVIRLTDEIPTTQRDAQARVARYFDRNCPQHSPVVKQALQSLPMLVPPEFY